MDHKYYFRSLDELGREAVVALRQFDERNAAIYKSNFERYQRGEITEYGYRMEDKALDDARQRLMNKYKGDIASLRDKYTEATEAYMMPSAGRMHPEDMEVLKNFKLSAAEFDRMAKKYADNPTMGRLLEDYRKENGIETNWRFQNLDARLKNFDRACDHVAAIVGQLDKYSPGRDSKVTRAAYSYYHELQGSDPDDLIAPAEEVDNNPLGGGSAFF